MTKKNEWDLTNKPQTKIKLNILRSYLSAWAKIFAKQKYCKKLYYVDCFAGRGKYHDHGQKNVINGSPLMALNIAKDIKRKYGREMVCFFIEKDPKIFRDLQAFTKPFKKTLKFCLISGDVNKKIDEVLKQIPDNRWNPIFFFIDPGGINIKSKSVGKILSKPNIKEFLITYIQKGVERCLGFGIKVDKLPVDLQGRAISNLKRVEDFFGISWKNLTKNERENLKKYLNIFVKYNSSVSAKDRLKFKTIDIFYNQGRNKYYLIFISRNETALRIIEHIYIKTKTDGTLFNILPPSERKRIFQKTFEI